MAITSQNGFTANNRSLVASYTVPGTTLRIALRKGDCSVVLLEYLRRYHIEVESLYHRPQDLWGYAERTIRGSSKTLSNHASGTAVDCRAVRHPLGATGTFTRDEERRLDNLLRSFSGVIRHGKDYKGRKDPMHAELVGTPAQIRAVADRIRSGGSITTVSAPPPPAPEEDVMNADQERLLRTIYDQITGNDFKGWPTWDGGTGESLSLVDYARRDNVEVRQLHANLQALHQKLDALGNRIDNVESGPSLNVTPAQVVDELLRRLKEAS